MGSFYLLTYVNWDHEKGRASPQRIRRIGPSTMTFQRHLAHPARRLVRNTNLTRVHPRRTGLMFLTFLIANFTLLALSSGSAASNSPPTIQGIPDQTVLIDHPTVAVQLGLDDLETPIPNLLMTGRSSNRAVVPDQNIFFGAAAGHWYVTVTPAFGVTGSSTITVTVSDGIDQASTSFLVKADPPPPGSARFASSVPITIPDKGPASPYPATLHVGGMTGTISSLTLTLSKFSHKNVRDVSMLLISPTGQGAVIFSQISGDRACTNVTVYLTDTSSYSLPASFDLWSEPLRPTDYSAGDFFPGAPPGPYGLPTFNTFRGASPNGDWSLYIYDDIDGNGGSIAVGWSLLIGADPGLAPPSIGAIANQFTGAGVTLPPIPFTVDDADTAPENLQITAASSDPNLVPAGGLVLGGTGRNRTLTVAPQHGQIGTATITLTVSDGTANASSSFFLTVTQANSSTLIFANPAPIVIPGVGLANPYPSTITVAGVTSTISKVTVTLGSLQHSYPADIDMLLVGPQGQKVAILSDCGRGAPISGVTLTFSDSAASAVPLFGPIVSGMYLPTDYEPGELGEPDSFPQAPLGATSTNLSVFNGTSPNGVWSLYVVDDGPGDQGVINAGWNMQITVRPPGEVSLTSLARLEGGSVQLRGRGAAEGVYKIEASENLVDWHELGPATADTSNLFEFLDLTAIGHPTRFYRASFRTAGPP